MKDDLKVVVRCTKLTDQSLQIDARRSCDGIRIESIVLSKLEDAFRVAKMKLPQFVIRRDEFIRSAIQVLAQLNRVILINPHEPLVVDVSESDRKMINRGGKLPSWFPNPDDPKCKVLMAGLSVEICDGEYVWKNAGQALVNLQANIRKRRATKTICRKMEASA